MYQIGPHFTSINALFTEANIAKTLVLAPDAIERIEKARAYLDQKIKDTDHAFYGINTGFGSLCDVSISAEHLAELQLNLVRSHSVGTGDLVPPELVRIMVILKVQSLAYGHSGVSLATCQRLLDCANADVLPVIYEVGSLGASGDLAPLAHLSLLLIGEGEVWHRGIRRPCAQVLAELNMQPITLQAKEGLALLNGTQFSTAYSAWCAHQANRLWDWAALIAATSADAFDCRTEPFDKRLHKIRPHEGQKTAAKAIRKHLKGSEIATRDKVHVQDPYAFRCIPQVHGASWDTINYVNRVLHTEINAVTDNPNIFPEDDAILSGGNFHAQPIALAADFLAIATAEIGSISERRTYQLIGGKRGLPAFLTPNAGLHSGLMIAQYTAAALASQNKQLCTPASVDSIVSCNGQEDHVSMAANAATKCRRVIQNVERLLAIELMCAMQGLDFRRPARSSEIIEKLYTDYRASVPTLDTDRIIHTDLEASIAFLQNNNVEDFK